MTQTCRIITNALGPLCLLLGIVTMSAGPIHAEDAPANLIPNGDFQTDKNSDGTPDGWDKPGANILYPVEDGSTFLRLHSTEPGKQVMVYKAINITPDMKALELTYRVRYENIKPGKQAWFDGRIMMNFKDAQKKVVKPSPSPPYFRGTKNEWVPKSQKFLVPEGAVVLELMPTLFQVESGTLDLDDLSLKVLGEAEAQAMAAAKAAAARLQAERDAIIAADLALPARSPQLQVQGNQVVGSDGQPVWLQGLSVDSMQWSMGENVLWSIRVAIDEWGANVIRLAVHDTFWFGRGKGQVAGTEEAYRRTIDQAVQLCAARGAYLVLDLHRFGAPRAEHVAFWQEAASRYKNNPAVMFELFNEPHGISWQVWRDGGDLRQDKHTDANPAEVGEGTTAAAASGADMSVGMQALVDAVRDTGARNIILAGGLDWAYDLTGIVNGYALTDRATADGPGHGIIYVSHIYPWKKGWKDKVLVAAEQHPVIITEIGAIEKWSDFSFIGEKQRYPLDGWAEDVLGMLQKHKLHWTGFSFHPRCGPMVIKDWNYTPTDYWGVYVKDALAGKQFEMKKMR